MIIPATLVKNWRANAASVALLTASIACAAPRSIAGMSAASSGRCVEVTSEGSLLRDSLNRTIYVSTDLVAGQGQSLLLLSRFAYAFTDSSARTGTQSLTVDSIGGVLLVDGRLRMVLQMPPIAGALPAAAVATGPDRWMVAFVEALDLRDSLAVPRLITRSRLHVVALREGHWGTPREVGSIDHLLSSLSSSMSLVVDRDGSLLLAASFRTPFSERRPGRGVQSGLQLTRLRGEVVTVDTVAVALGLDEIALVPVAEDSSRLAILGRGLMARGPDSALRNVAAVVEFDGRARALLEPGGLAVQKVTVAGDAPSRWIAVLADPGRYLIIGESGSDLTDVTGSEVIDTGIDHFDLVTHHADRRALLVRRFGAGAPLEIRVWSSGRESRTVVTESDGVVGPEPRIRFVDDSTLLLVSTSIRVPGVGVPAGLRSRLLRIRC